MQTVQPQNGHQGVLMCIIGWDLIFNENNIFLIS